MQRRLRDATILAAFAGAALLPAGGSAQPLSGAAPAQTFGPVAEIAHTVHFSQLEIRSDTGTWISNCLTGPSGGCAKALGAIDSYAAVTLPAGARVTRIELDGCDGDNAREIVFALHVGGVVFSGGTFAATGETGVAATPGCGRFAVPLATPITIDNVANVYTVVARSNPSPSATLYMVAIRVYYQLQVSPAPGTATFGDVPPSHPFFRFVEALAASGITAGCGGGNYCPDASLTRGQMAVFLAKALGLHFAP